MAGNDRGTSGGQVTGYPFPQVIARELEQVYRLDEYLDNGPVLISNSDPSIGSVTEEMKQKDLSETTTLRTLLRELFEQIHVQAILLRPDGIIFRVRSVK